MEKVWLENYNSLKTHRSPSKALEFARMYNSMPVLIDTNSNMEEFFKARSYSVREWLSLSDVDFNQDDPSGSTIFEEIMVGFDLDLIPLALDKGCDPNKRSIADFGNTPLVWAVANDSKQAVMTLVELCQERNIYLDVNAASKYMGNTPLILSIAKAHEKTNQMSNYMLTEYLLKLGANPNKPDDSGNTPLHIACLHRDFPTINLLRAYGANPNLPNSENKLPFEYLYVGEEKALQLLIKQAGGDENFMNEYISFNHTRYQDPQNLQQIEQLFSLPSPAQQNQAASSSSDVSSHFRQMIYEGVPSRIPV